MDVKYVTYVGYLIDRAEPFYSLLFDNGEQPGMERERGEKGVRQVDVKLLVCGSNQRSIKP